MSAQSVDLACEVDLGAVRDDAELAQGLQTRHPVADSVANFRLEPPHVLEVVQLGVDLERVRDQRHQPCQREHRAEQDDVPELHHQLHVVGEDVRLVLDQLDVPQGLIFSHWAIADHLLGALHIGFV